MRTLVQALLLLLASSWIAAGCGGGGSGGSGSSFEIELLSDGGRSISGEVTLPEDTGSGHAIQFVVAALSADPPYTIIEPVGATDGAGSFGFRILGASSGGSYQIRAAIDLNDSGVLDTGDPVGWFDGTVAAPIQDDDFAATIEVAAESVEGTDFGIGPLP